MPSVDPFFEIRATRANPPGKASENDERRLTYAAALDQFDELMVAAKNARAHSRPLPLFYALSQAGRAIAAAHAESNWRLKGHGLSAPDLAVDDICDLQIKPVPGTPRDETSDSFAGVSAASGCRRLHQPALVGELWSSLPGICDYLSSSKWRRPLLVVPHEPDTSPLFDYGHVTVDIIGLLNETHSEVIDELSFYPIAAGAEVPLVQDIFVRHPTTYGLGIRMRWPTETNMYWDWHNALEHLAPTDHLSGHRWLRPAVAGSPLNPLMSWWALLFGLSMMARYEPASWGRALDLDQPGLAAQLAKLLDIALEAVPLLVTDALVSPIS